MGRPREGRGAWWEETAEPSVTDAKAGRNPASGGLTASPGGTVRASTERWRPLSTAGMWHEHCVPTSRLWFTPGDRSRALLLLRRRCPVLRSLGSHQDASVTGTPSTSGQALRPMPELVARGGRWHGGPSAPCPPAAPSAPHLPAAPCTLTFRGTAPTKSPPCFLS